MCVGVWGLGDGPIYTRTQLINERLILPTDTPQIPTHPKPNHTHHTHTQRPPKSNRPTPDNEQIYTQGDEGEEEEEDDGGEESALGALARELAIPQAASGENYAGRFFNSALPKVIFYDIYYMILGRSFYLFSLVGWLVERVVGWGVGYPTSGATQRRLD